MRNLTRQLLGSTYVAAVATVAAENPTFDGTKLTEQSRVYEMTVELLDETVTLTATTTWTKAHRDGRDVWHITSVNESSLGRMVEDIFLGQTDLSPLQRIVQQGEVQLDMSYVDGAVRGTGSFADGQQVPIDVALSGSIVGHIDSAIAVLPLAPGFDVVLTTFEPTMQMERQWRVVVAATEAVDTALGMMETYRLELSDPAAPGAPGVYWVTRASPHHTVKSNSTLPDAFGGGGVNAVLTAVSRSDQPRPDAPTP